MELEGTHIVTIAMAIISAISAGGGLLYRGQLGAQKQASAALEARAVRAELLADRSQEELHESNATIAAQTAAIQSFKEIAVMMLTQGTDNAKLIAEIATRLDALERRLGGSNARTRTKPPV